VSAMLFDGAPQFLFGIVHFLKYVRLTHDDSSVGCTHILYD